MAPTNKPKSKVAVRSVIARMNRKLAPERRVVCARSHGDKQFGNWLLIERNFIKDGWASIEHLEDYARGIQALAVWEMIEA